MPISIYDGKSNLTMTNGTTYSLLELKAVPRFYTLATERCLIWQDGDGITFMWRRWEDMLSYLTEDERTAYDSKELPEEDVLDMIITRMSATAPSNEELADATIEIGMQTVQNTEDIALCMDALIELGNVE